MALYDAMKQELGRLEQQVSDANDALEIAIRNKFIDSEWFQSNYDIANARAVGAFIMFKMLHQELGFQ